MKERRLIDANAVKAIIRSGISTDTEADQDYVCELIDAIPTIEPNLILPERMERGDIYEVGETIVVMNHDDYYDLLCKSIEPKRGKWIGYNEDKGDDWLRNDGTPIFLVCNKCYGTVINNGSAHWNFCPNCGCAMTKE